MSHAHIKFKFTSRPPPAAIGGCASERGAAGARRARHWLRRAVTHPPGDMTDTKLLRHSLGNRYPRERAGGLSPPGSGSAGHRAPSPAIARARPQGPRVCCCGFVFQSHGESTNIPRIWGVTCPSRFPILPNIDPHSRAEAAAPSARGATRGGAAATPPRFPAGAGEQWTCPSREVFTDGDGTSRDLDTPAGLSDTRPTAPRAAARPAQGSALHSLTSPRTWWRGEGRRRGPRLVAANHPGARTATQGRREKKKKKKKKVRGGSTGSAAGRQEGAAAAGGGAPAARLGSARLGGQLPPWTPR
ncbi:uncharacterized protein LOC132326883 [Haemorhous mexicanus]|uniref:uncharacterized protein LOC132326883 n=1 Tax=Haemorhous mexicanus TaxID=30427 RepID=UPI0028BDBEB7|nr:uncharacterized protein LOC132326883 [Haemorhous mexicanus]